MCSCGLALTLTVHAVPDQLAPWA